MPRAETNKVYNSFVKGLITEASAIAFPENASVDELNCVLFRKGNRKRRLGIDYELNYSLSTNTFTTTDLDTIVISTDIWKAVGGNGNLQFLVIQVGSDLFFHDLSVSPLSDGYKSFTVDMTTFKAPAASNADVASSPVSISSGRGACFVTSKKINPFIIEYDSSMDSITSSEVDFKIRDFEGVDDGLEVDENPATLTNTHNYNLLNQGWVNPPGVATSLITSYFTSQSEYPANNQIWFLGKDTSDNFSAPLLAKQSFGTTPAPKGHYLVDPFYIDRSSVSGVASIAVESEDNRPTTTAFFAGRVWYAGVESGRVNGNVYFSQILNNNLTNAGYCYQAQDPTSEHDSVLVADDGGVVTIPDVGNILELFPTNSQLIVIADNGIWTIGGTDGGFKATDYRINFVTSIGALNKEGIVDVEGVPVFWSDSGIYTLSSSDITDKIVAQNLSADTIQSYYEDTIPADSKRNAIGEYDRANKRIEWYWQSDETVTNPRNYDSVLVLDTRLGAFYPWRIEQADNSSPFVASVFRTPTNIQAEETSDVYIGADNVLISADQVVITETIPQAAATSLKYLAIKSDGNTSYYTFAEYRDTTFHDWVTDDGAGANYSSYINAGYELFGDTMRFKEPNYVYSYFNRTETGFELNESGGYDHTNPSSCFLQGRFEWADSSNSNRWSSPQQAYRFLQHFVPDTPELEFDNGFPVIVTRNKIRGKGHAIQVRYYSEEGKDFDLLGWAINVYGNTKV